MALICQNCHSINHDPGGDPSLYLCGVCGRPALRRIEQQEPAPGAGAGNNNALAATLAGGAIGGAFGGPVGILVGGIIGAFIGSKIPNR